MSAVQAFVKDKRDIHIHLRMDNTSAHRSGLSDVGLVSTVRNSLISFMLSNVIVDFTSGDVRTSAEWKIHEEVFHMISSHLGLFEVDLLPRT